MKYTEIPFVDKPVSRIVLGGSGRLFNSGGEVAPVMEAALESGINCVDTAREYGKSEEAIGRYLRRSGRREDWVLVSKCCHPTLAFVQRVSRQAAEDDLKRSLDLLGTDRIDIYFLHRDNELVDVGVVAEFMHRFHEEGRIGAFGGSNWSAKRITALNDYAQRHGLTGFTVSSPHYSLGRQRHDPWGNGCKTITGDRHAAQRAEYARTRMPLFCWSSLCSGLFSGQFRSTDPRSFRKRSGFNAAWGYDCPDNYERLRRCEELALQKGATVAQIALAWLLGSELNTMAIVGGSSPDRIRDNAHASEIDLTEAERRWLNLEQI